MEKRYGAYVYIYIYIYIYILCVCVCVCVCFISNLHSLFEKKKQEQAYETALLSAGVCV
jgi:hypothetical protein